MTHVSSLEKEDTCLVSEYLLCLRKDNRVLYFVVNSSGKIRYIDFVIMQGKQF